MLADAACGCYNFPAMTSGDVHPSAAPPPVQRRRRRVAIFLWPVAFAIAGPAGLVLFSSISSDAAVFIGLPYLGLWAAAAFVAFLLAMIKMIGRRWRGALSLSIMPLAALAMFVSFKTVWDFAADAGVYIHFRATRAALLADIAKLPTDKGPRLAIFDWGGFLGSVRAFVYDESDEITLPEKERSAAWKKRAEGTELSCEVVRARPVGNHFYITDIDCS
jgi:hypothetical protein